MTWIAEAGLSELPTAAQTALASLTPTVLPKGTPVFHAGQTAEGFPVVLSGRIDVHLIGPTGRDILLYSVAPGQSCVQTTLGLLGDDVYSGEAVAAQDSRIVVISGPMFLSLMDSTPIFRAYVFRAFANRMQSTMHVLEKVAFQRVEARLADGLLSLANDNVVTATQAELASHIGSAREVVSRQLDSFAKRGWVTRERGKIMLKNRAALAQIAEIV